MNKSVPVFIRFLLLIAVLAMTPPVQADESVTQQAHVDQSVVDHYTNRKIVSASAANITLDDGSSWSWEPSTQNMLDSPVGQTVKIQFKPSQVFYGPGVIITNFDQGSYEFMTSDASNKTLIEQSLAPSTSPLTVEAVEVMNYEQVRKPNVIEKMTWLPGDFKTTALVTLSDKSKWLVSLVKGNPTTEKAANTPVEVGSSATIVWASFYTGTQPMMVVSGPGTHFLTIEGTY